MPNGLGGRPAHTGRAAQVRARLADIERQLAAFPVRRLSHGDRTEEIFPAVEARFVRIVVQRTGPDNDGPAFDEVEVFAAAESGAPPVNVALASAGATPSSSGAAESLKSKNRFLNDGKFGNASLWVAATRPEAWVQINLPKPMRIDRVQ